jgi:hypothetical protein
VVCDRHTDILYYDVIDTLLIHILSSSCCEISFVVLLCHVRSGEEMSVCVCVCASVAKIIHIGKQVYNIDKREHILICNYCNNAIYSFSAHL